MFRTTSDLPDKERLLVYLITQLMSTQILKMPWKTDYSNGRGNEYVHFATSADPTPGDLVICKTSGVHEFTIAWLVEKLGHSEWLLRELGSDRTCKMGNEGVYVIRGLTEPWIWEGDRYEFYKKVCKAFWKTGEDWYRYGGLAFNESGEAVITVREKFGGCVPSDLGEESVPFTVTMTWNKRTTVRAITKALIDGGVGTRKFERRKKESVNA